MEVVVPGDALPGGRRATRVSVLSSQHAVSSTEEVAQRIASTTSAVPLQCGDVVMGVVTRITRRAAFVSVRTRRGRRLAGENNGMIRYVHVFT